MILIRFTPRVIHFKVQVDLLRSDICAVLKWYLVVSSTVQILCTCVSVLRCYNMHMLSGTYELVYTLMCNCVQTYTLNIFTLVY